MAGDGTSQAAPDAQVTQSIQAPQGAQASRGVQASHAGQAPHAAQASQDAHGSQQNDAFLSNQVIQAAEVSQSTQALPPAKTSQAIQGPQSAQTSLDSEDPTDCWKLPKDWQPPSDWQPPQDTPLPLIYVPVTEANLLDLIPSLNDLQVTHKNKAVFSTLGCHRPKRPEPYPPVVARGDPKDKENVKMAALYWKDNEYTFQQYFEVFVHTRVEDLWDDYDIHVEGREFLEAVLKYIYMDNINCTRWFTINWMKDNPEMVKKIRSGAIAFNPAWPWDHIYKIFTEEQLGFYGYTMLFHATIMIKRAGVLATEDRAEAEAESTGHHQPNAQSKAKDSQQPKSQSEGQLKPNVSLQPKVQSQPKNEPQPKAHMQAQGEIGFLDATPTPPVVEAQANATGLANVQPHKPTLPKAEAHAHVYTPAQTATQASSHQTQKQNVSDSDNNVNEAAPAVAVAASETASHRAGSVTEPAPTKASSQGAILEHEQSQTVPSAKVKTSESRTVSDGNAPVAKLLVPGRSSHSAGMASAPSSTPSTPLASPASVQQARSVNVQQAHAANAQPSQPARFNATGARSTHSLPGSYHPSPNVQNTQPVPGTPGDNNGGAGAYSYGFQSQQAPGLMPTVSPPQYPMAVPMSQPYGAPYIPTQYVPAAQISYPSHVLQHPQVNGPIPPGVVHGFYSHPAQRRILSGGNSDLVPDPTPAMMAAAMNTTNVPPSYNGLDHRGQRNDNGGHPVLYNPYGHSRPSFSNTAPAKSRAGGRPSVSTQTGSGPYQGNRNAGRSGGYGHNNQDRPYTGTYSGRRQSENAFPQPSFVPHQAPRTNPGNLGTEPFPQFDPNLPTTSSPGNTNQGGADLEMVNDPAMGCGPNWIGPNNTTVDTLYVSRLDSNITGPMVRDFFGRENVLLIPFIKHGNNQHNQLPFALVQFVSTAAAKQGLKQNGTDFNGRKISVQVARCHYDPTAQYTGHRRSSQRGPYAGYTTSPPHGFQPGPSGTASRNNTRRGSSGQHGANYTPAGPSAGRSKNTGPTYSPQDVRCDPKARAEVEAPAARGSPEAQKTKRQGSMSEAATTPVPDALITASETKTAQAPTSEIQKADVTPKGDTESKPASVDDADTKAVIGSVKEEEASRKHRKVGAKKEPAIPTQKPLVTSHTTIVTEEGPIMEKAPPATQKTAAGIEQVPSTVTRDVKSASIGDQEPLKTALTAALPETQSVFKTSSPVQIMVEHTLKVENTVADGPPEDSAPVPRITSKAKIDDATTSQTSQKSALSTALKDTPLEKPKPKKATRGQKGKKANDTASTRMPIDGVPPEDASSRSLAPANDTGKTTVEEPTESVASTATTSSQKESQMKPATPQGKNVTPSTPHAKDPINQASFQPMPATMTTPKGKDPVAFTPPKAESVNIAASKLERVEAPQKDMTVEPHSDDDQKQDTSFHSAKENLSAESDREVRSTSKAVTVDTTKPTASEKAAQKQGPKQTESLHPFASKAQKKAKKEAKKKAARKLKQELANSSKSTKGDVSRVSSISAHHDKLVPAKDKETTQHESSASPLAGDGDEPDMKTSSIETSAPEVERLGAKKDSVDSSDAEGNDGGKSHTPHLKVRTEPITNQTTEGSSKQPKEVDVLSYESPRPAPDPSLISVEAGQKNKDQEREDKAQSNHAKVAVPNLSLRKLSHNDKSEENGPTVSDTSDSDSVIMKTPPSRVVSKSTGGITHVETRAIAATSMGSKTSKDMTTETSSVASSRTARADSPPPVPSSPTAADFYTPLQTPTIQPEPTTSSGPSKKNKKNKKKKSKAAAKAKSTNDSEGPAGVEGDEFGEQSRHIDSVRGRRNSSFSYYDRGEGKDARSPSPSTKAVDALMPTYNNLANAGVGSYRQVNIPELRPPVPPVSREDLNKIAGYKEFPTAIERLMDPEDQTKIRYGRDCTSFH